LAVVRDEKGLEEMDFKTAKGKVLVGVAAVIVVGAGCAIVFLQPKTPNPAQETMAIHTTETTTATTASTTQKPTTSTTVQTTTTTKKPTTTTTTPPPVISQGPAFQKNAFSIIHADFTPSDALMQKMNHAIKNNAFRTSFYLESLDGSLKMGYNPDDEYFGASTIKVAVALYAYQEVAAGRADLNTRVGNETMGNLLSKMLDVSDNDAYKALRDYFGKDKINQLTANLGCRTFKIAPQWAQATPRDAAIVWRAVNHFCNSSGSTGTLLMNQLVNAKWNQVAEALGQYKIPHKYGYTNQPPIVYAETCLVLKDQGRSYIFTYYTTGSDANNNLKEIVCTLDLMMKEYDLRYK